MPVSPPLTTTESGTATSVRPTNTLEFNGADFTVTGSGDKATISIDSTGTGAALTDTYIGFGNASNLLTGSASLTFDDTNKKLLVIGDSDNDTVFEIQGGDTAAGAGPRLTITNTAGTDSDIQLTCDNYAVGILSGGLGATQREVMRFGQMSSDSFTTVFNEGGLPADFRIEGDTEANLFYLDGGQDNIGIGGSPTTDVETLEIFGTGSVNPMVQLRSTETGASSSPHFSLYRNNTGSSNDDAGLIEFKWDNAADTKITGAQIYAEIQTATAGSEANRLRFYNQFTAGFKEWMRVSNNGIEINAFEDNIDTKMSGDVTDGLFFLDASEDNIGIGGQPSTDVERLHVKGTSASGSTPLVVFESTGAGAADAPFLDLHRSITGVANSDIGNLRFTGMDAADNKTIYARIWGEIRDPDAGDETGAMIHQILVNNVEREFLRMSGNNNNVDTGYVVFNEGGIDMDFRIETENVSSFLSIIGNGDRMGIGGVPDSGVERLHIQGTGSADPTVMIESTSTDLANQGPELEFYRSANLEDGDRIGVIRFSAQDDGGAKKEYGRIEMMIADETDPNEDGEMIFYLTEAGSIEQEYFRIRGASRQIEFNTTQDDIDFVINSDGVANFFYMNANQNNASFGGTLPVSGGATLQVPDNTISSYCNVNAVRSDGVATQTMINEDCQGQLWVNDSATAWTLDLPESTVKGQHFRFVSTNGDMTVDPNPSGGTSNTINGGTGAISRNTDNQIYEVICIDSNKWILNNP